MPVFADFYCFPSAKVPALIYSADRMPCGFNQYLFFENQAAKQFFEGKLQVASWPDCRCIIIDAKMGLKLYKKPFLYNYWAFFGAIIIHFSFCTSVLSPAVSETSKNTPFQIHFHITKKAVPSKDTAMNNLT